MSAKIILQNALAQLEAERDSERAAAESVYKAQLKSELDTFTATKQKELDDTIALLKAKFDETIAARQVELDELAQKYVATQNSDSDKRIEALKSLIADIKEV